MKHVLYGLPPRRGVAVCACVVLLFAAPWSVGSDEATDHAPTAHASHSVPESSNKEESDVETDTPAEKIIQPPVRLQIGDPGHRYSLLQEVPLTEDLKDPALTTKRHEDGTLSLRIPLKDDEAIWGFGQRLDAFDLRGRRIECWATDGWNDLDTSYFAVPFFISSEGYGLFLNSTARLIFDIGATDPHELLILVPEHSAELIVFRGDAADISKAYTELVGRPRSAPEWIYRPWMSRNSYLGAYEINRMLRRMYDLEMPVGVVVLEAWAEQLHNFQFERRRYPNPITWMRNLNKRGVHVVCWITPSVWSNSEAYRQAQEQGFLVRNADGSEHIVRWLENGRKIDFRDPHARAWWTDMQKQLVATGISGIKTDGGEHMPDPFFHNEHPYHYQKASLDAFEDTGREGITFARSANPLNAGLGLFWAGDQKAEWSRLEAVVRAGLSTALSGFPLWGHDIGGYSGIPTKDLYIRWLQFGAFSPIMQFHGEQPREPWRYDEETLEIAQFYFKVRERLLPFLREWGDAALDDGTPIIRPLVWHFPDDPLTHQLDSQFMLGPDLVVAPMVRPEHERQVYLPEGTWTDLWSGQNYIGPAHLAYEAQLHQLPVFVRADAHATYEGLFADAPARAFEPVTVELAGTPTEWGIAPYLRYWRDQDEWHDIQYRITNHGDEAIPFAVRLAPTAGIEARPRTMMRFSLAPGETSEVAYQVRPIDHLMPATYPLTFEVRSPGKDYATPTLGLVISPAWKVLGPLDGGVASEQDLDPHNLDLNATIAGKFGLDLVWRDVTSNASREDGLLDLGAIAGEEGFSTSYLHTTLFSQYPRRIRILTGCGDAMTMWVNGQEVLNLPAHRNPERDEDVVHAVLLGGLNRIVVRISRDLAPHHFYFRVE